MRIAMVSEHASPLAALGSVDAGGQNVHVAELAAELGRRGIEVVVYTRRDDESLPARVAFAPNVFVEHVDAGPPRSAWHSIGEPTRRTSSTPISGCPAVPPWRRRGASTFPSCTPSTRSER